MPIYEYRCAECHAEFEVWQKMSDKPVHKCEKCGGRKVSKLISQTSFQLKGSGWYVTDYARKSGTGPAAPTKEKPKEKAAETKKEGSGSCGTGSGSASGACGGGGCGTK